MVLLGESLAPSLGAYASEMRTRAMHDDIALANGQATWLRDGDRIVSLRRQAGDLGYGGGVLLFELGPEQALKEVARADSADLDAANRWVLSNYAETSFDDERRRRPQRARVDGGVRARIPICLELSVVREDLLDTPSLVRYIGYLEEQRLDAHRYLVAYWSRIASVVSVVLMTVLALPFVFGGLRSAGAGARLVVGLIIGLTYYVPARC